MMLCYSPVMKETTYDPIRKVVCTRYTDVTRREWIRDAVRRQLRGLRRARLQ